MFILYQEAAHYNHGSVHWEQLLTAFTFHSQIFPPRLKGNCHHQCVHSVNVGAC